MNKSKIIILILTLLFSAGCLSKIKSNRPVYKDRDSAKKLAISIINNRYDKKFIFVREVGYDINRYGIDVYEEGFPESEFRVVINNKRNLIDSYLWVLNKSEAEKITADILSNYPEIIHYNAGLDSGNNDGLYDIKTPFKKYIRDKDGYIGVQLFILEQKSVEETASIVHNIIKDFHEEGLSLNLFVNVVPLEEVEVLEKQLVEMEDSPSGFYFEIYSRLFKIKNKDWSNYEETLSDMKERVRLEEEFQKKQKQFE